MSGYEPLGRNPSRFGALSSRVRRGAAPVRALISRWSPNRAKHATVDDAINDGAFADLQAEALHEFARALPNNLQIKPLDPANSTVSETFHVRDFPRFLIALESAELDSAATAKTAPRGRNRFAKALVLPDIKARLLRARLGRGLDGPKFKVESVAYAAAFVGIVSLAWASAGFLRKSPTPTTRLAAVEATASSVPQLPNFLAPGAQTQAPSPGAYTDVGPSLFDPTLEGRLSFGAHMEDGARPASEAPEQVPPLPASEPVVINTPDAVVPPLAPAPPPESAATAPTLVTVRNLPPNASLSAGTRVSDTEWSLAPSDLSGLVVTLPKTTDAALKAEIEIAAPTGVSRIEIRQPAVDADQQAARKAVAPLKIARRRKEAKTVVVQPAQAAGVVAPASAAAAPKPAAAPAPAAPVPPTAAAGAQTQAAAADPTVPPPAPEQKQGLLSGLSLLPFWPTPYDPSQPSVGLSADQETMINLGVVPRE
ncbi:MAG: hypothetical protein ACT4OU_10215 [Hyphomicrobium sp.]